MAERNQGTPEEGQDVPKEDQGSEGEQNLHVMGEIAGGYLLSAVMMACLSLWAVAVSGLHTL